MFSLNKSLTQSPLILNNRLADTHEPENKSVFRHEVVTFYIKNLQFGNFFFIR